MRISLGTGRVPAWARPPPSPCPSISGAGNERVRGREGGKEGGRKDEDAG